MTEPVRIPDADTATPDPHHPGARAFRLSVEYDGTHYAGWQCQPSEPTVQQSLEEAVEQVVRHPVRIDGAGRTDAGVHALAQVARLITTACNIDAKGLLRGSNTHLPEDIRVTDVLPCRLDFDPRRDARERWYRYTMLNRPAASALNRFRQVHIPQEMDWNAVDRAIAKFEGAHDFSAFRSAACRARRTRLNMIEARHVDEHPLHHFDFRCRSFLHNQVRLMSGLLIEIGLERHRPETVRELLRARRRQVQFRCAPAHGLVLVEVCYPAAADALDASGAMADESAE